MQSTRWAVLLAAMGVSLGSCKDSTAPAVVPTEITLSQSVLTLGSIGSSQSITATVKDQNGRVIPSPGLIWTSSITGVADVSPAGVVTAIGVGTTQITARADTARAHLLVTVPGRIVIQAGNNQAVPAGTAVSARPAIRVTDLGSTPVVGISVTFAVSGGGGSITGATTTTDAQGVATVGSWTLGASPGTNTLTATVNGSGFQGNPATFSATGTGGQSFEIEVRYTSDLGSGQAPTTAQRAAFTAAAQRWGEIIVGDLTDLVLQVEAGSCAGWNRPALDEQVDDVIIYVLLEPIDGPFGVLGSAGPCFIRNSDNTAVMGVMRFDTADITRMETNGTLGAVIQHEMGHVLGLGTLWGLFNLIANPSRPSSPGVDTHYTGSNGIAGFDLIGGLNYSSGSKVPLENNAQAGSADTHWRESVLAAELMTPAINAGTNPLSVLTARSLQDMGYAVAASQADPFSITVNVMAGANVLSAQELLLDDVIRAPVHVLDRSGRVVRTVLPPAR
ncbi:MAG TPA: leishmanolysin-related zinc metalloendopeptidase [Gemmatimonadaceae bacterium]|nr:leishmanolysin-related zinc metalloendopeptidase [Gemmatimonadaceae bacterium]